MNSHAITGPQCQLYTAEVAIVVCQICCRFSIYKGLLQLQGMITWAMALFVDSSEAGRSGRRMLHNSCRGLVRVARS